MGQDLTPNALIVEAIKNQLNNPKEIGTFIAQHLHLSKSAVYRKMNGEVPFSLQEALDLARHFGISIDSLVHAGSTCTGFQLQFQQLKREDESSYYNKVYWILKNYLPKPDAPSHMFTLTQEIMPFTYMNFPELTAFQILLWSKATMRLDITENTGYVVEARAHDPELIALSQKLLGAYNMIPSTEFISSSLLDQNLSAILQFAQQPFFAERSTPLLLCEQLEQMVRFIFQMARIGEKRAYNAPDEPTGVPITLYHDPLANYGTVLLLKSKERSVVYHSVDFPNYMSSRALQMVAYTENWINNCKSHSFRISGEGELYRNQLLQSFLKKIEATKRQLQ
jgi:hypothetical protein